MLDPQSHWLELIGKINVNKSGERRAPHKPLLLLIAISRHLDGRSELSFVEVERTLRPLLNAYAPPVKGNHQPALPYWYLQSDGLWEIADAEKLPRQAGGFPRMDALRKTTGHLTGPLLQALVNDRSLISQAVHLLLENHFPQSLHDDICAAVGLEAPSSMPSPDVSQKVIRRRRDPAFREKILRAYEYRCAATGFCAALGGSFFGCEAAHVRWVAYDGPDTIENGIALEPTLHKLFDAGAWSLTDDRRMIVSADFTGTDETVQRIRSLHGKPLKSPQPGQPLVSIEFVRWHREEAHGGVFRLPAMPL